MTSTCIILNADISTRKLRSFATDPGLTIDITALEPGRLPSEVKARIWSSAEHFMEPNLQYARADIIAPNARKSDLSALEEVGGATNFQSLIKYAAPRQVKVGNLNVKEATRLTVPALEVCGDLVALQLRRLSVPRLRVSGHMMTPQLTWLSAREWREAGAIQAPVVERFSAPKLDVYQDQTLLLPSDIKMQLLRQSMRMLAERLTQNTTVPEMAPLSQAPTRVLRSSALMKQINLTVR